MSARTSLKYIHLAYFSKPAQERVVYRQIRRRRPRSIVEVGVGNGQRAQRMIRLAAGIVGAEQFRYTGIDLFEARSSAHPGITIKLAHKVLRPLAGKVQLIPGDPFSALSRSANSLTESELVLIGADQDQESIQRAWFYLPRMLSERSLVLLEEARSDGRSRFRQVSLAEVTQLAQRHAGRRAA